MLTSGTSLASGYSSFDFLEHGVIQQHSTITMLTSGSSLDFDIHKILIMLPLPKKSLNKKVFQYDAYRPLVDRGRGCTVQGRGRYCP